MELIIGIGVGVVGGMYLASQIEKGIRSNINNKNLINNLNSCKCKIDGKRKKKKTN
tara:strand:- start:25986 stop:26153 length:168 start_codon:yes stop_codon:yes gene_type:complete